MQPRARRQRQLFEEPPAAPAVRLPLDVQEQLRQALVHLDAGAGQDDPRGGLQ
jgi:hypothetical protein